MDILLFYIIQEGVGFRIEMKVFSASCYDSILLP